MKKFTVLTLFIFALCVSPALAANTSGHAWSESVDWFDFSNTTVSDSSLTGYAYNDNTGWLVMDGVTNSEGELGGYAWSESVGYFDFSDVMIVSGDFEGYAYNDNIGWLSFEAGTNVVTAWEPSVDPGPGPDPEEEEEEESRSGQKKRPKRTVPEISVPDGLPPSPTLPSVAQAQIDILIMSPDLEFGAIKEEVRVLQRFLNSQGFAVNPETGGPGSAGYETNYFGSLTQQALARFQAAHNILPSVGYFGPKTKAFITSLTHNN